MNRNSLPTDLPDDAKLQRLADQPWTVVSAADVGVTSLPNLLRDGISNLWTSRELAWRLFQRNFAANHRQSLLGWLWIFLPPLASAGVWVLLNASGTVKISHLSGMGYAAFVFVGMMLWQAFVEGLQAPMNALQSNRNTLTKLQFPKEVLITVAVMEVAFDLLARSAIAIVLLLIAGTIDGLGLLLLIGWWAPCLILLGIGAGLWLAPFGLLYKDIGQSLAMITPLWMLLSPVIYPLPDSTIGSVIAWVNPPAAIIQIARDHACNIDSIAAVTPADAIVNDASEKNTSAASAKANPELPPDQTASSDDTTVSRNIAKRSSSDQPVTGGPTIVWPALGWAAVGVMLFASGLVWLRISSPIVIERLAN